MSKEKEAEKTTIEQRIERLECNSDTVSQEVWDLKSALSTLLKMYRTDAILVSSIIAFLMNLVLRFFFIR